jgi:hypothetical protein
MCEKPPLMSRDLCLRQEKSKDGDRARAREDKECQTSTESQNNEILDACRVKRTTNARIHRAKKNVLVARNASVEIRSL